MNELDTLQTAGFIWIIVGITLVLLEVIIPGGFVVFLGISAVITGLLAYFEFMVNFGVLFLFWAALSLFLILLFRSQVHKWFPSLERFKPTTEYTEMFEKEVEVVEDVGPDSDEGRVRFQGTTWKAMSREGNLTAGEKAKIIGKKNITLIVAKK